MRILQVANGYPHRAYGGVELHTHRLARSLALRGHEISVFTRHSDVAVADGTVIDKANEVVLTRWQNKVYAFGLACPHQNTALRWSDKEHQFECPKHHSRFEPDGVYIKDSGRATRAMDRLPIHRDGNNVVVTLDKLYQEDEDEAAWKAAVVNLSA